jgi:hypothetical protein
MAQNVGLSCGSSIVTSLHYYHPLGHYPGADTSLFTEAAVAKVLGGSRNLTVLQRDNPSTSRYFGTA